MDTSTALTRHGITLPLDRIAELCRWSCRAVPRPPQITLESGCSRMSLPSKRRTGPLGGAPR